jgi:hypothetical protein
MINLTAFAQIDDLDLDGADSIFARFGAMLFRANVRAGGYSRIDVKPTPSRGSGVAWLMNGHGNPAGRADATRGSTITTCRSNRHACAFCRT